MKHGIGLSGVAMLLLAACSATGPARAPTAAASGTVDELAAAIALDAERSDHEADSRARDSLARDAGQQAAACLAQAPRAAACLYYHAVALGLEAKAHPLHAAESLKAMVDALVAADAADPQLDHAGPSRVRALVLIRAPAWPLGPGDPEGGLSAAQRAVNLQAQFPPNVLALAEAQAKTGNVSAARESYAQAHELAANLPSSVDRDEWLHAADTGLKLN